MSATVRWTGMSELEAALRSLPEDLATDAGHDVLAAANATAVRVRTEYGAHAITGRLRDSVVVEFQETSRAGVRARVRVTDPIAWIFDHGSQVRHWVQGKTTGKMWARRPPSHIVARTAAQERRRMYARLKDMLTRHGFRVSGDA